MISWIALKTIPVARAEFRVEHGVTQHEFPAMLPYELLHERKPGKREFVKVKQALFPRYVFAGLQDVGQDFDRLRKAIPEIQGIVSRSRDEWSPLILPQTDVALISQAIARADWTMTEVDLHKGFKPGKMVEVSLGSGAAQTTKIESVTKKGIKALLTILGNMPTMVEVPFDRVRAA